MRARMAIAASGIDVEHREIALRDKPAEMLTVSEKGTVPVIVMPDGTVIGESLDIMMWALHDNDPGQWLHGIDEPLILANDGHFKAALDRYKYPHRYGLDDGFLHRGIGLNHLEDIDRRLRDRLFLHGDDAAFTDIALFPFVRQYVATDPKWFDGLPLTAVKNWLDSLVSMPLFAQIMMKHSIWQGS
jgi:glutathione S-transferase